MTEDEKLAKLHEEMYHNMIEVPEEQEKEIIDVSQYVSKQLYFHPDRRVSFEFAGVNYRCTYTVRIVNFKKNLFFIAFNVEHPTRPITAQAEIENGLSELENLRATIAAFLRNRLGKETVGEITDDEGGVYSV